MPQVSVSLSEEEIKLLVQVADETGRSRSELMSEYIRQGLYEDVANLNRVAVFWQMKDKRAVQRGQDAPVQS